MYVKKSISNGKTYLSFVQGYRENGKVKQKIVEKIGYLDDLEKEYADPLAHFRRIALERSQQTALPKSIDVNLLARLADHTSQRKNLGYAVLKRIYSKLALRDFFQKKQRSLKVSYNLNSIFSLLVFNRFLFSSSKQDAYSNKEIFFESFHFSLEDIYLSSDYFAAYSKELQKYLHHQVCAFIGRSKQVGYYDVANYFFKIPYENDSDCDVANESFQKPSKKHRSSNKDGNDPIIQMGLLIDSNGIPMAFNTFSGGRSEKTSLLPALRRFKNYFDLERLVVVADKGLSTGDNAALFSGQNDRETKNNDGYIYGQNVLETDPEFREWVLDRKSYHVTKEKNHVGEDALFIHKSRIHTKKINVKNQKSRRNTSMEIQQKQIVYYSENYAKKQKQRREQALIKIRDIIANPDKFTRATSGDVAVYINNLKFVKGTGEIRHGIPLSINQQRLIEEEQYDGYHSILTSEMHLSDQEIRDIYYGLWEIEDSFNINKSEFNARPLSVHKDKHVEAHFLTCFVTLVITRVLEQLTAKTFTTKQIHKALTSYSCSYLDQNYYLFDYRDDVLKLLEETFGFDFGRKIMSLTEIKAVLQYEKQRKISTS